MTAKTTTRRPTAAQRKARVSVRTARSVFGLGLLVSIAANVVASEHTVLGIATGVWAPVALLLALIMLENGAVHGRWTKVAVGLLALVAGWMSYWHLVEVLEMAGVSDYITLYLMPLTVDVLMMIASQGMKTTAPAAARRRTAAKRTARKAPAKLTAVA